MERGICLFLKHKGENYLVLKFKWGIVNYPKHKGINVLFLHDINSPLLNKILYNF